MDEAVVFQMPYQLRQTFDRQKDVIAKATSPSSAAAAHGQSRDSDSTPSSADRQEDDIAKATSPSAAAAAHGQSRDSDSTPSSADRQKDVIAKATSPSSATAAHDQSRAKDLTPTTSASTSAAAQVNRTKHEFYLNKSISASERSRIKISAIDSALKTVNIIAMVMSIELNYYRTANDSANEKTGRRLDIELVDDSGRIKGAAFDKTADAMQKFLMPDKV